MKTREDLKNKFNVNTAAAYLAERFAPIAFTDGFFRRYTDGVWRLLPEDAIRAMAVDEITQINSVTRESLHLYLKDILQILSFSINRREADWPVRPYVICLKNGVIDLEPLVRSMVAVGMDELFRPHDPAYGCRVQLPVEYDPGAACDRWTRALREIFPNGAESEDEAKLALLQQFAGYMLLPTCKYQRCLLLVGAGSNGKSTLINTIIRVLGENNTLELGTVNNLARAFNIPYLQDKLLVICDQDMSLVSPYAVAVLKKCISGDLVSGELKYRGRIDFYPTAKFVLMLNESPQVLAKKIGLARKTLVIDFNQQFLGAKAASALSSKLIEERAGIFNWMLSGAIALIKNMGFSK